MEPACFSVAAGLQIYIGKARQIAMIYNRWSNTRWRDPPGDVDVDKRGEESRRERDNWEKSDLCDCMRRLVGLETKTCIQWSIIESSNDMSKEK